MAWVWFPDEPSFVEWVCWFSLYSVLRGFPSGTPVFPSHQKPTWNFDLICCDSVWLVVSSIRKATVLCLIQWDLNNICRRSDLEFNNKNSEVNSRCFVTHYVKRESHFKILRKCQGKFDVLVFEMLYIKKFKPNLNVQTDSIRAKLFVQPVNYFFLLFVFSIYRDFARQTYWMAGQWKLFALERTFVPMEKRIYCSCHPTWLPCKTSIELIFIHSWLDNDVLVTSKRRRF